MNTAARFLSHLLFTSTLVAGFVWLAPWRLAAPPPEPQKPQRIQRLPYPTFHLRPQFDPYKNDILEPVLQASKPIDVTMFPLNNDVGLFLVPGPPVRWNDQYMGRRVRLYNNTNETRAIPTVDYALYVVPEARDREGQWRDMENYPTGFCGFSYFSVNLEPRYYWEFTVPVYKGSFHTRMRYVLSLGGGKIAYSEEFHGSVAPELLGTAWEYERKRPDPVPGFVMPGTTQPL